MALIRQAVAWKISPFWGLAPFSKSLETCKIAQFISRKNEFLGKIFNKEFLFAWKKPQLIIWGRKEEEEQQEFLKPIKIAVFKILGYGPPHNLLHMLFSCHSNWFFKSLLFNQTLCLWCNHCWHSAWKLFKKSYNMKAKFFFC